MRLGAAVHSSSPAAVERPQWLYLGSRETSVCRLGRIFHVVVFCLFLFPFWRALVGLSFRGNIGV